MPTSEPIKSRALERFNATLDRADSLVALYKRLLKVRLKKKPNQFVHDDVADLLRSSLVLAVAAMDSYFTARFTEALVPFLKKHGPTDALVDVLAKAGLDTREALKMIEMDRPYRRIRRLMDTHFERFTTQRAKVIDDLFIAYGLKDFSNNSQRSVKRRNLIRRIELMVQRRHEIVHGGDVNAHGNLNEVDPKKIPRQIEDLKLFVSAAHRLSQKRLK